MYLRTEGVKMYKDTGLEEIRVHDIDKSFAELMKAIRRDEHCVLYLAFYSDGGYLHYELTGEQNTHEILGGRATDKVSDELEKNGYHIVYSTSWSSMTDEENIYRYIHDTIFYIYDNDLEYYDEEEIA